MKFPSNLVTFTEDILNGKLHFLCSDSGRIRQVTIAFRVFKYFESIPDH